MTPRPRIRLRWLGTPSHRLSEIPREVDSALKVNVPQLIILGVTRFATQEQVDASINPLVGQPLALHPDPVFKPDEMIKIFPCPRVLFYKSSQHGPNP